MEGQIIHPLLRGVATKGKARLGYELGLYDFSVFDCSSPFFLVN